MNVRWSVVIISMSTELCSVGYKKGGLLVIYIYITTAGVLPPSISVSVHSEIHCPSLGLLPNMQSRRQLKTYYARPPPLKWGALRAECGCERPLAETGVSQRAWAGPKVRDPTQAAAARRDAARTRCSKRWTPLYPAPARTLPSAPGGLWRKQEDADIGSD